MRRESRVREAGGSDPPVPPPLKNTLHEIMHLLLPFLVHVHVMKMTQNPSTKSDKHNTNFTITW